MQSIVSKIDW